MLSQENDTIAAISTALGMAAIGVIRITGPRTRSIIDKIFVINTAKYEHKKAVLGWINDPATNTNVDESVLLFMKAPNSSTGEDLAEISCHGGVALQRKVLRIILDQGARLADRGEFTKRAFLNGKIDLLQAEAVIQLIQAKTEKAIISAANNLGGSISREIADIKKDLMELLIRIEAEIDFPEDIAALEFVNIIEMITSIDRRIMKLLSTERQGRMLNEGVSVGIIGKPNVGKSSILNAILKEERAIVTEIPGTTTDTIEEFISIGGFPFKLIDTAGIRQPSNQIEKVGIARTEKTICDSEIILAVFDWSREFDKEDERILSRLKGNAIIILNKTDKRKLIDDGKFNTFQYIVKTEAINDIGIKEIEDELQNIIQTEKIQGGEAVISSERQAKNLKIASLSLKNAKDATARCMPADIITIDIKEAMQALGEMSGESITNEIIDGIFNSFCIGK